jgi:protein involved in polysaccharide export with SLBB domain
MKTVRGVLFVLFTILFCSNQLHAQNSLSEVQDLSHINIDDFSDSQLISFHNKAIESGISESQFYQMVSDRGLPPSEVIKLKERLQDLHLNTKTARQYQNADQNTLEDTYVYDSSGFGNNSQTFQNDESIFGSELFTTNSLVFEPNLRIPAPVGYILGPDDQIIISVYGFSEQKYNLTINKSGEIYIPNVGPLFISGLSIEEATQKIKSTLASTIYKAINSGKTKVQVSLGKIRSIRVTVIGQAKKPGTYTVSSLTTLYNILYLCGGPTPMGSYRDIEIIRGNSLNRTADLYDFLINGNEKDNIILQEGDVIRIPYYKNRVVLSGNVKREGKFEMLDNETFNDLLKYSGGFTDNAFRGSVTVIRITDTAKKIIDLSMNDYNTFQINGSDRYIVRQLQDEFENRVVISGSVLRPGPYQLTPELTVNSLIQKAGGLSREAYTKRITIFRSLKNKMPTMLSFNLDSSLEMGKRTLLMKDDSVAIHSIFEFEDSNYVTVQGNVRKPGTIPWRKNFFLSDLLIAAGGVSEFGDSSTIEISRRIKKTDVNKANHTESQIFNVDLTKNEPDVLLQPYDMVIVKKLPGYNMQRTVLVLGDVKSPGTYSLEKSGDRISDVLKRAGGFKVSADSSSVTIRRRIKSDLNTLERERLFQRIFNIDPDSLSLHPGLRDELNKSYDLISVNLSTALSKPTNSENLVLEDGDVLTINRSSNLVKISGEVYFPTIIPYKENKDLKYYVEQAGNFTPYARKTGALVIHPDGKAASVKHFLWFKFYPSVTPRSEIFVPQRTNTNKAKISIGEWSVVLSSLALLTNVLYNITK